MENKNWLTKDEAEAFIGKNSWFYLEKWKSHSEDTLKGWNWPAAVFGLQWMMYRKMYLEALLFYVFQIVAGVLIGMAFWTFRVSIDGELIRPIFGILTGIFGNMLYRNKALRILRKTIYMDEPMRVAALQEKGGTSVVGVIVGVIVQIIIAILLVFLTSL